MTRPRKTLDLRDVLDGPVNPKSKSQKRTTRLYENDITQLISDFDINDEDNSDGAGTAVHPPSSQSQRRNGGGKSQNGLAKAPSQTRGSRPVAKSPQSQAEEPRRNRRNRKTESKNNYSEPLKPLSNAEHTNVTCRFVIKSDCPLTPTSADADKPFNSKQLWRIYSSPQECPICLERAEVPRMLGCGHVMCYHCMIKHRKFSPTSDTCPICGDAIFPNPSRALPVTFLECIPELLPREDDVVDLTLMCKPSNSLVALPVMLRESDKRKSERFPDSNLIYYTRVCQEDVEYAKREMAAEVKYLIGQSKQFISEFGYDAEGYDEAVTSLKKDIHNLNVSHADTPGVHSGENNSTSKTNSDASHDFVYFYQSAFESQVVYTLSPLDVSILKAEYGSFDKFPLSLVPKVQNIEFGVLNVKNDKRMKFLSHLPEQTPVAFLECDWTGIINPGVLRKFKSKLDERERNKRRKMAKDVAERQKAQDAIDQQFKTEVAEAMLTHERIPDSISIPDIDTSQLPSLIRSNNSAAADTKVNDTSKKVWVDERKEYEELMKHAYVPKKGRKDIILRF